MLLALALAAPAEGSVEAYVEQALQDAPRVEAAFEQWQAAVHSVARERRLPDPTLSFGAFVQSVETRVGPQQARVSVQQAFPWPSRLVQGGKAADAGAQAAEAQLRAVSLEVAATVEQAYWTLWEVRTLQGLHEEHLAVLDGLAATVASRVEVGNASLADLQQVDLARARLEDELASMGARDVRAQAALRAALGRRDEALPTVDVPEVVAADEVDAFLDQALRHPRLSALEARADAAEHRARALGGQRLPDLTVGADWIATGPAGMDTPDAGKDAVAVGVGVKVPLWQGSYGHDVEAARATERAWRAEQQVEADRLLAEVEGLVAEVQDTARREERVEGTLLPQAEAAYRSVLGQYAVGETGVASTLLAQRDLLELAIARARARAGHQRAWARLHSLVGGAP